MSGICESGLMLMFKKFGILGALSELLEPHLFGRTGALKFGAIGVQRNYGCFFSRKNEAPRISKGLPKFRVIFIAEQKTFTCFSQIKDKPRISFAKPKLSADSGYDPC